MSDFATGSEEVLLVSEDAPLMLWVSRGDGPASLLRRSPLTLGAQTREQALDGAWIECVHPEDLPLCLQTFRSALTDRDAFEVEYRLQRADGGYRWMLDRAVPRFTADGAFAGYVGACLDITNRKLAEDALRESEERHSLAARAADGGLWDWDLRTEEMHFSAGWVAMSGWLKDELGDRSAEWFDRIHPDDTDLVRSALEAHLAGRTARVEVEYRLRQKTGGYRWMLSQAVAVRDSEGHAVRMVGYQTDVTGRKQTEEQLLHDAVHDALTGLPNRTLFIDRLGSALARAKRRGEYRFAVLFLDLDRFKLVNDSLGHAAGDRLLVTAAERVQFCLREGDTVARLGGDEFVILLDDVGGPEDVIPVAERIQVELGRPIDVHGDEMFTTASIGIALGSPGCDRPEDLLRDADTAMYDAKALGKARHVIFEPSMRARAVSLLNLENDLRRAIEAREFQLHFQPTVALGTGRVTGFEALVRWQRPGRGLIAPAEFIPLAEETGLIVPIGLWAIREACRHLRAWQARCPAEPALSVAVNLSGKQCTEPDLVQQIDTILRETGINRRSLKLEITESILIETPKAAAGVLERLRTLGIQLLVDDFGTGYSSLSCLRRFPVDALKIDQSFISRMETSAEDQEIVRTIVTLAHNLGMYVIAEGVETAEQLARVRALGCEYAQGFFLGEPVEAEAIDALIVAQSSATRGGLCLSRLDR